MTIIIMMTMCEKKIKHSKTKCPLQVDRLPFAGVHLLSVPRRHSHRSLRRPERRDTQLRRPIGGGPAPVGGGVATVTAGVRLLHGHDREMAPGSLRALRSDEPRSVEDTDHEIGSHSLNPNSNSVSQMSPYGHVRFFVSFGGTKERKQ